MNPHSSVTSTNLGNSASSTVRFMNHCPTLCSVNSVTLAPAVTVHTSVIELLLTGSEWCTVNALRPTSPVSTRHR